MRQAEAAGGGGVTLCVSLPASPPITSPSLACRKNPLKLSLFLLFHFECPTPLSQCDWAGCVAAASFVSPLSVQVAGVTPCGGSGCRCVATAVRSGSNGSSSPCGVGWWLRRSLLGDRPPPYTFAIVTLLLLLYNYMNHSLTVFILSPSFRLLSFSVFYAHFC